MGLRSWLCLVRFSLMVLQKNWSALWKFFFFCSLFSSLIPCLFLADILSSPKIGEWNHNAWKSLSHMIYSFLACYFICQNVRMQIQFSFLPVYVYTTSSHYCKHPEAHFKLYLFKWIVANHTSVLKIKGNRILHSFAGEHLLQLLHSSQLVLLFKFWIMLLSL